MTEEIKEQIDGVESWVARRDSMVSAENSLASEISDIVSLRPGSFEEYVGQEQIKRNLLIACDAALARKESLDHVSLHGPPGLGKTSLAKIIANRLGVGFRATSGPVIERPGDLAAILSSLERGDVLFIDEIHRLSRVLEEVLYPAMEDFKLDILIGQGPSAKSIKIDLKPFTLIGATTRTGLLTSPLWDRFGLDFRLSFYDFKELSTIAKRSAAILEVDLREDAALEIGERSRGTPRIANRILKRIRDYAQQTGDGKITLAMADAALRLLDIDEKGLDHMDRSILAMIINNFAGGPVGVDTIAAAIGEDRETIEEVYEPYLLQAGFLARTRRGREATELAFSHLGLKRNQSQLGLGII